MSRAWSSFFIKGYSLALYLLAFSIPLLYNLQSIGIMLLGLCWLLSGQYRHAGNIRRHGFVLWWLLYFALNVLSLLYTSNMATGLNEVGRKLSFLLLPLFLGGAGELGEPALDRIYLAYVLGDVCSALLCIGHAAAHYTGKDITVFYYDNLPYLTDNNAVFAAWKCVMALAIVLYHPFRSLPVFSRAWMRGLLFLVLFVFFILLSSKTLIVFGVAGIFIASLYRLLTRRGPVLFNAGTLLLIVGVPLLLICIKGSPIRKRYQDIGNAVTIHRTQRAYDIACADNYSKRMALWTAAWQNYREQKSWLFGSGSGDVQDLQDRKLAEPGFHYESYYNFICLQHFNTHNMYLQTLLGTGLIGLLTLVGLLVTGWWLSIRRRLFLLTTFFLLCVLFLAQESALQLQSGIVYMSFFTCVWANVYWLPFIGKWKKA